MVSYMVLVNGKVKKIKLIVINLKVLIVWVRNADKAYSPGLMVTYTKAISQMISSKGMVKCTGPMEQHTKVTG